MKKVILFFLLVFLVIAGVGGYFYSRKDAIVLERLTQGLQDLTGAPSEMTGVVVTPKKIFSLWEIQIGKITIQNQGIFRVDKMAILQNVKIELNPLGLLAGKWKIRKLSAHLYRSYFQVNAQGVLNAAQLPGIKMLMVPDTSVSSPSDVFHADKVELTYGKFYRINDQVKPEEKKTYPLEGKADIYMNVNNPNLLVQAPVFTYLSQMNLGSFGLPRGKLQESIRQYVSQ